MAELLSRRACERYSRAGFGNCVVVFDERSCLCKDTADFVERMNVPNLVDGRKIYDPKAMLAAGVNFYQIGYSENKSFVPS